MSNIEKIRQEIEWLKDLNVGLYTEGDNSYYEGQNNGYNHILAFIDSLPEEDPLNDPKFCEGFDAGRAVQRIFDETEEKPSEELEKAASRLGFDYVDNIVHESPEHRWNDHDVEFGYRDGFIDGAKWQKAKDDEERQENKRKEDELPRFYGD